MHSSEWSLVFFTTISQLAAGMIIAVLPFVFSKKHKEYAKMNQTALYSATGLMLIALVLSFLHLNNPVNSVYALSNLKTSWLSREILFVSLFLFFLVIANFIIYFKNPQVKYYKTLILVTASVGVVLVYTMSKLYIIPTVPPWNSISTMIEFYSTALLIGSAFVLGLSIQYETKNKEKIQLSTKAKTLAFMAIITILIIVVNELFLIHNVAEGNVAFKPLPLNGSFMLTRWLTILLGAVALIYIYFKKNSSKKMSLAYYLPFTLFLISELIARVDFYTSFYNIGL